MNKRDGELAFGSHLGFFGEIRIVQGKVVKTYKGALSENESEELVRNHQNFVEKLRSVDIYIPQTDIKIVSEKGKQCVCIEQEQFDESELAGEIIKRGDVQGVLFVVAGIVNDAVLFIHSGLSEKIGFHPTIRNYAVRDGVFYMLDTFPPFTSQEATMQMMRRHAPSKLIGVVMRLFPQFLKRFTVEYYDPVEMLYGIYASAVRLRPEFESDITGFFFQVPHLTSDIQGTLSEKIEREGFKQKTRWRIVSWLKS